MRMYYIFQNVILKCFPLKTGGKFHYSASPSDVYTQIFVTYRVLITKNRKRVESSGKNF